MEKQDKAITYFYSNQNCAQSVVSVYADQLNLDPDIVKRMATGFGSGMGRLQKTCGAVTGAYMVLGLMNSRYVDKPVTETTYSDIQVFTEKFMNIHSKTNCRDLLDCDLNTEEGKKHFQSNNLKETVCSNCIRDAISILEEMKS